MIKSIAFTEGCTLWKISQIRKGLIMYMFEDEIRDNKFISCSFYTKLLANLVSIEEGDKHPPLEQYKIKENQEIVKKTICSLFPKNKKNREFRKKIFMARGAKGLLLAIEENLSLIKSKCLEALKNHLENFHIPNDVHGPEEMFFLKIKSCLIFYNTLDALELLIDDEEIQEALGYILFKKIDELREETQKELESIERRVSQRSFPSDIYYPWHLYITCEHQDLIGSFIGQDRTEKLINTLEEISLSINFTQRPFSGEDEKYILFELAENGYAKIRTES